MQIAALLISNGADINAVDEARGMTPLNCAIRHNRPDVAKVLVMMGANVNIPDTGLVTPLHNVQGFRGQCHFKLDVKIASNYQCSDKTSFFPCIMYLLYFEIIRTKLLY